MNLTPLETEITHLLARREMDMIDDLALQVAIPTGQGHAPGLKEYRGLLLKRLDTIGATFTSIPGIPRPDWLYNPTRKTESTPTTPEPIIIAKAEPAPPEPGLAAPVMGSGGSGGAGGVRVLIAGHLDTVHDPHGPFQKLTIAQDGKTATGPGVVDMKGGIVIALHALEVLHELKVPLNWTFLLNADEETGSFSSIPVLQREAANHDFGIALEPALLDGSLATERMGSGQFCVEVRGRSAHVGRSFSEGISAVNALAEIMLKLEAMADPENGIIVNVGPLQGSEVTNAVPDYAACWGNVRVKDAATGEKFITMLNALCREGIPGVSVNHQFNRPAKPGTDAVMEFAHRARQAAEDLGQSLPFASTGGVCDGNILQSGGLPTLDTLGVRGGNLHRPDEWIEIASLKERSQMLAVLLSRLASPKN